MILVSGYRIFLFLFFLFLIETDQLSPIISSLLKEKPANTVTTRVDLRLEKF